MYMLKYEFTKKSKIVLGFLIITKERNIVNTLEIVV